MLQTAQTASAPRRAAPTAHPPGIGFSRKAGAIDDAYADSAALARAIHRMRRGRTLHVEAATLPAVGAVHPAPRKAVRIRAYGADESIETLGFVTGGLRAHEVRAALSAATPDGWVDYEGDAP